MERKEHFTDELSHVVNDNLHLDFPETTEEMELVVQLWNKNIPLLRYPKVES